MPKLRHSRIEIQTLSPELRQYQMARLALERANRQQIDQLRALSVVMASERPDHQPHSATAQEVLLLLSNMTGNRVWQMLARRLRILLRSEALREMRQRIPVDFNRLSALLNDSVEHHLAGRANQALAAMRQAVELVSERYAVQQSGKRGVRASRR
jgi:DNA-binding FadR family transcriptional regulator